MNCLVLFLLLLHVLSVHSAQTPDQELIHNTCMRTPYYDLCISTIRSNPRSSITDVRGMGQVIARVALSHATDTLNHIKEMLKESKRPESQQQQLQSCLKLYNAIATYVLPEAIEGLDKGNNKFAYQGAIDTATVTDSCLKLFKDGSLGSLIIDRNRAVHDLSIVVASLVNILLRS